MPRAALMQPIYRQNLSQKATPGKWQLLTKTLLLPTSLTLEGHLKVTFVLLVSPAVKAQ